MATKTFKIGLSNTDKQNMAQDVYERLLALTFPEYDTTTEYEVGDFVVYNDQLYKCIGATTGAWDSSKWQLATLNDLVSDIEDAVQFVNDKANVDGNYPTMTVGVADNLSPYDETSGINQHAPFNFQASGTNNGADATATVGELAIMSEKRGNTVAVNQLANIVYYDTVTSNGITFSLSSINTIRLNGTATDTGAAGGYLMTWDTISGHKYLICTSNEYLQIAKVDGTWSTDGAYAIREVTTGAHEIMVIRLSNMTTNVTSFSNLDCKLFIVDLTQWFNGDIPEDLLDNPDHFFRYYQGSLAYNKGTLVNANSRYLKAIGRNQWDEVNEIGRYDTTTGEKIPGDSNNLRNTNPIKVISGNTYYIKCSFIACILCYDNSGNLISVLYKQNETFAIPSNCDYINFFMAAGYGTTYNHDITISLYYEGESGYDKYYPYELLTDNDTGSETLLAFDYKTPDGIVHRETLQEIDLGDFNWGYSGGSGNEYFYTVEVLSNVKTVSSGSITNARCSKYVIDAANNVYLHTHDAILSIGPDGRITVYDASTIGMTTAEFETLVTGVKLQVEKAEPTTEQGTPYSENLVIDDFGSMDFGGTNGVPQGNLIFYPVDYKAFIDTLYDYSDGTPSNIALKSDLSADKTELQGVDSQLLNAIGGTLRQCLCVKESLDFDNTDFVDLGSLTWAESGDRFYVDYPSAKSSAVETAGNLLCSLYSTQSADDTYSGTKGISIDTGSRIWVYDSAYNDVTTFKNAMKNVLLAYEKAEE